MCNEVLLKAGASVPQHLHKNFKNPPLERGVQACLAQGNQYLRALGLFPNYFFTGCT